MKVEKKIQRTGGGTPYVYLPKEWVEPLFPEQRATIQRLPLGLLVTPPSAPAIVAHYRADSVSAHGIKEAVLSAYTQGHREARVTFQAQSSRVTSEVSRFAARLMGVIAEVRRDAVRLREYTEHERVDLALPVQGLFAKCREMASASRDLLGMLAGGDAEIKEASAALERIEDDADFLSFGLFRLLSSRSRYVEAPEEQLVDLLYYSIINYAAERYCDALYGITGAVGVLVASVETDGRTWAKSIGRLSSIADGALRLLERAEDVVLRRDGRMADGVREEVRNARKATWEPLVAKAIQALSSSGQSESVVYPATQIGNRLLESGTYLESFFSRTSQFYYAGKSMIR